MATVAEQKVAQIEAAMAEKNVTNKEILDIEENILPKNGVFEFRAEDHVKGDGTYAHVRIGVKGSPYSVSLANLQIRGIAEGQTARFGTVREDSKLPAGSKFLRALALNPELSTLTLDGEKIDSVAKLVAALDGRAFSAKETTVLVLPYAAEGWQDPSDADLAPKTAYRIHLK